MKKLKKEGKFKNLSMTKKLSKNKIENKAKAHNFKKEIDDKNLIEKVYIVENVDCANCAAKIERRINNLPEIQSATYTFATQKLKVVAENPDKLLDKMSKIADTIEPNATINEINPKRKKSARQIDIEIKKKKRKEIVALIGFFIYITGIGIYHLMDIEKVAVGLFVFSYILLGGEVVLTALKNISRGQIFDENFLMSIATIGAFAIGEYPEAIGVMFFYRIGEFLEDKAVDKSRSQIDSINALKSEKAILIVEDKEKTIEKEIDVEDVKVGDIILLKAGMRVPVDGKVVSGETSVDKSPITGETLQIFVEEGDELVSGSINLTGTIKMEATKILKESMITTIINAIDEAVESKPKMERFITRFAAVYTPIVVAVALITAIAGSIITGNHDKWVYIALTFLVISCPCALVLSVPMTYFAGIGVVAKQGILFKGGIVLERLKNIKHIVFDKTGTLTKGNFQVEKMVYTQELFTEMGIDADRSMAEKNLLSMAYVCEKNSQHPIAVSITKAIKDRIDNLEPLNKIAYQVVEEKGKGMIATLGEEQILCGNERLMEKYNVDVTKHLLDFQGTVVIIAKNGKVMGSISISDQVKDDSVEAIEKLKKQGYKISMITGDNKDTAKHMAWKMGIDEVFSEILPHEKFKIIKGMRKAKKGIMFVGDGINDGPVLAGADVGVAMGSGTDVAIQAADVVLLNSNLNSLAKMLKISKKANFIAISNVVFAIGVKLAVMLFGLFGIASMWTAVFADSGVTVLCLLNSMTLFKYKDIE